MAAALWALLSVSGLALWLVLYGLVFSGIQQHRDNAVLYSQLREQISGETAPLGGAINPGSPVAVLTIPSIGLSNEVVIEGTTTGQLRSGPGHLRGTPLPGQVGVSQIYGKAATFGAPFGRLARLRAGQTLTISTGQGVFSYTVNGVRRPGDPLPAPLQPGASRVLLATATGGLLPSHEIFVDATLRGDAQPAPTGSAAALSKPEQAMGIDPSGLVPLIFWLQGLLVVSVGLMWVRARLGGGTAWLIGMPIVLAIVWGAAEKLLLLLPNLV